MTAVKLLFPLIQNGGMLNKLDMINDDYEQKIVYSLSQNKVISYPKKCVCDWDALPSYYDYSTALEIMYGEKPHEYLTLGIYSKDGMFKKLRWILDPKQYLEVGKTYGFRLAGGSDYCFGTFEVVE